MVWAVFTIKISFVLGFSGVVVAPLVVGIYWLLKVVAGDWWVGDDKNQRSYGSKTDAYRIFAKMLKSGRPPDDWDELLVEAQ